MATHASAVRISASPRCSPPAEKKNKKNKNHIFGSSLALRFPGSSAPGEALPTLAGLLDLGEHLQPAPFRASFRQLCPTDSRRLTAPPCLLLKSSPRALTEIFDVCKSTGPTFCARLCSHLTRSRALRGFAGRCGDGRCGCGGLRLLASPCESKCKLSCSPS